MSGTIIRRHMAHHHILNGIHPGVVMVSLVKLYYIKVTVLGGLDGNMLIDVRV